MASENRASSETIELTQALAEAPYKFNFFQVMRLIEAANPGTARLGESARPADDPIRLGQEPSLAFAPAMLAAFRPGDEESADYLSGYFFGLFGPNGPLPLHLSEYARDREKMSHDPTFRAFADIFHHRMMSLFYRAWADSQPTVHLDRPDQDRFTQYVGSTFGMGLESHHHRDSLADHSKLYMAGRLALQTKPAEGMQAMLEELFRVPMHVEQYIGEWMALPTESRLLLGDSPQTGSLGMTAALGERVWGGQHKFRIQCGPLNGTDFRRFLPGGESLEKLCATVRNYIGDELDWELRLLLLGKEVTNTKLAESGRLGWTSWIGETSADAVIDDVVLNPLDWATNQNRDSAIAEEAA